MRVADRHDGVVGEQGRQQSGLHDRGVLVLVEQDDARAIACDGGDLRRTFAGGEREGDLVGELDESLPALLVGVPVREVEQDRQGTHDLDGLVDLRVRPATAVGELADADEPFHEAEQLLGGAVDLGELVTQREDELGHLVDGLAEGGEPFVSVSDHDAPRESPGGRLGQQDRLGLTAHQEGVVAEQGVRIGVVGGHLGTVEERVGRGIQDPDVLQGGDPLADPCRQLTRGLPGEGEPQDPVDVHVPVGEQPHDA